MSSLCRRTAPVFVSSIVACTGSERASASGAEGSQLREACAINSSLSALSSVISKLTEAQRLRREGAVHIPYRDSRLTFLLRVRSIYALSISCRPICSFISVVSQDARCLIEL